MNILVIGGSGYIGKNLLTYLSELDGVRATLLNRNSERANIQPFTISTEIDYKQFKNKDVVINLASPSENDYRVDAVSSLYNYINFIKKITAAAKNTGAKKLIHISTIKVYGTELIGLVNEDSKINPQNIYSLAHSIAEKIIVDNFKNPIILRVANGYGGIISNSNSWDLIVNNFCYQAVKKNKITIISKVDALRSYISVPEICRAIVIMINNNVDGGIYNVGCNSTIRLSELADIIQKRCEELGISCKTDKEFHLSLKDSKWSLDDKKLKSVGVNIINQLNSEIPKILNQAIHG